MGQFITKAALPLKIFTDEEYGEIVRKTDLHDKIKRIILEHGPFIGLEINAFVEENLNRPVIEEIFNDIKGNEDIRNAMKKYGVTTVDQIMPELLYLEFFDVNENLQQAPTGSTRNFMLSMKTLLNKRSTKATWNGKKPNKS